MSNPQTTHSENSIPLNVTINDTVIEDTPIDELLLVRGGASEMLQEIENEISKIHISDEPPSTVNTRVNQDKTIEVTLRFDPDWVKDRRALLEEVSMLTSPRFGYLFEWSAVRWAARAIVGRVSWIEGVAVVVPPVLFTTVTLILVYAFGEITSWVLLATLIGAGISFYIGLFLLRFVSESRKYLVQEKIERDNREKNVPTLSVR